MANIQGNSRTPAFWASAFASNGAAIDRSGKRIARRALAAMRHPQGFGNYFTYGAAIQILGRDPSSTFVDGSLKLSDRYCDFGYMWSQLGAPVSAIRALAAAPTDNLSHYLPDLSDPLREVVARKKFGRERSDTFDVLGTEGAQGAIGYAFLSLLDPGDEVLITDPGYMHFASGPVIAGARVRRIPLTRANRFRLDPDEVEACITPRTKMLVLCDPINPFGTIQSKDELLAIVRMCERRKVIVLNNTTHSTHQVNPAAEHTPATALGTENGHVLGVSGMSKGHALAALRLGFIGGDPRLLAAVARVRMETTGIHIHPFAQHATLPALLDETYVTETTALVRRNLAHLHNTLQNLGEISFAVEPDYGFCACLDVSGAGVSAQELTVALFRQGMCVIAGDALGNVGATQFVRINYSARDIRNLERFRAALPIAIKDAQSGRYLEGVQDFYRNRTSQTAKKILAQLERLRSRRLVPVRDLFQLPIQRTQSRASQICGSEGGVQRKRVAMNSRLPPSFLASNTLKYGPLDILTRFFKEAYDAARSYGVHLAFGTFDHLLKVNLANQRSWRAVIPTFNPRYSDLTPANSLCLLGYNEAGEVVATQACRVFTWAETNFFEAGENLSLFYSDPAQASRSGETCEITAKAARDIRGRVAFSGAGWYRPDYRGKYLSLILPRISRACAFTRWSTDYTTSMFQDSVLAGGMAERCGYTKVEWAVDVKGSPMGDIKFAFVWMEPDELIDDLRTFTTLIDTEVNGRVRYRRA